MFIWALFVGCIRQNQKTMYLCQSFWNFACEVCQLTMNFLPIPRFVALVLVLLPMSIYLDFRTNFWYDTGNLGSACIGFKNLCDLLKLMNPLMSVMKCLLSSQPLSNLLQISRYPRFVSPVNWLVLNAKCLKLTNQRKV